jgi:glycosyltransferase involved in cell wall biosynthesis
MSSLVCHLCHFQPETTSGTFLDAVSAMAIAAGKQLHAETLCIFPEAAAGRPWLDRLKAPHLCMESKALYSDLIPRFQEADAVLLHSHFVGYDGAAARLVLFEPKRFKAIIHLHSEAPKSRTQAVKDLVKTRLLGRYIYDRFIAVSENVYENALSRGVPKNKLRLVENAIDVTRYAQDGELRRGMRAEMGFKPGDTVVLLLGWDPERKGVDLFLDAVAKVAGKGRVFCIIGQAATWGFVAKHLGDSRPIDGLRLLEPTADFSGLLNAIDVFVSASRSEGSPYAILEAMATEKMVIASDLPASTDRLGDSVWRFPSGNVPALAHFIGKAVAATEDERRQIGRANRATVLRLASLNPWAHAIAGIYEELWTEKGGESPARSANRPA